MNLLPRGWHQRPLSAVCEPVVKMDPITTGRPSIKYVDIGTVDGEHQRLTAVAVLESASAPGRARQVLRGGDTVFSTVRPYLRKIAYIDHSLDGEFASTGFTVLRPSEQLDTRYLFHYCTSYEFLEQVLPHQRGVSYPAVRDRDVLRCLVPVPPLKTQRRIVQSLEEHLSRLDGGTRGLVSTERRLNALTSSQIEGIRRVAEAGGAVLRLGELAVDSGYGTSTKCVARGVGAAVVRIPNLRAGGIDLSDEKRVEDPAVDVSSYLLAAGDLLIVRTNGSRDLIGRTAVVPPEVDAAFASYLIRYRFDSSRVRPEWIQLMMQSGSSRSVLESMAASSAGQYNLSMSKLDTVPVPVPDLRTQDRFLMECGLVVEAAQRARLAISKTAERVIALRRALLSAAFSGGLSNHVSRRASVEEFAGV